MNITATRMILGLGLIGLTASGADFGELDSTELVAVSRAVAQVLPPVSDLQLRVATSDQAIAKLRQELAGRGLVRAEAPSHCLTFTPQGGSENAGFVIAVSKLPGLECGSTPDGERRYRVMGSGEVLIWEAPLDRFVPLSEARF